jgi:anthranilate phosphoribosyltransferase
MSAPTNLQHAIKKLVTRTNLSSAEISEALDAILGGMIADTAIAAFLVALATKGETADEVRSVLHSLINHATRITPKVSGPLIDTCGTGGDSIRSFNISTAAAIVACAAGARVAKHGNRSMSGICGSADFFEFIGLDLMVPSVRVQSCIEEVGIGFLFAPQFHPSMKKVASIRKAIGISTVFNKVGPLSNPCTNISGQLIGLFDTSIMELLAEVCKGYRCETMLVHARDGFDELSNTCQNDIRWISSDNYRTTKMVLHPNEVGLDLARPEQLMVYSKEESIRSTLQAIYGNTTKEKHDIVVLNAAAALILSKIASSFKEGIQIADDTIESGKASAKLSELIKYCGNLEKLKEVEKEFSLN